MAIAITLSQYLSTHNINYKLINHRATDTALDTSHAAHVPSAQVSKSILLSNQDGEAIMAIVSAGNRLSIEKLNQLTGKEYSLVNEQKLITMFPDCEKGAIPAVGAAYNINMLVDDSLLATNSVYIEAGDHQHLIKMGHQQFAQIIAQVPHGDISGQPTGISRLSRRHQRDWQL